MSCCLTFQLHKHTLKENVMRFFCLIHTIFMYQKWLMNFLSIYLVLRVMSDQLLEALE